MSILKVGSPERITTLEKLVELKDSHEVVKQCIASIEQDIKSQEVETSKVSEEH